MKASATILLFLPLCLCTAVRQPQNQFQWDMGASQLLNQFGLNSGSPVDPFSNIVTPPNTIAAPDGVMRGAPPVHLAEEVPPNEGMPKAGEDIYDEGEQEYFSDLMLTESREDFSDYRLPCYGPVSGGTDLLLKGKNVQPNWMVLKGPDNDGRTMRGEKPVARFTCEDEKAYAYTDVKIGVADESNRAYLTSPPFKKPCLCTVAICLDPSSVVDDAGRREVECNRPWHMVHAPKKDETTGKAPLQLFSYYDAKVTGLFPTYVSTLLTHPVTIVGKGFPTYHSGLGSKVVKVTFKKMFQNMSNVAAGPPMSAPVTNLVSLGSLASDPAVSLDTNRIVMEASVESTTNSTVVLYPPIGLVPGRGVAVEISFNAGVDTMKAAGPGTTLPQGLMPYSPKGINYTLSPSCGSILGGQMVELLPKTSIPPSEITEIAFRNPLMPGSKPGFLMDMPYQFLYRDGSVMLETRTPLFLKASYFNESRFTVYNMSHSLARSFLSNPNIYKFPLKVMEFLLALDGDLRSPDSYHWANFGVYDNETTFLTTVPKLCGPTGGCRTRVMGVPNTMGGVHTNWTMKLRIANHSAVIGCNSNKTYDEDTDTWSCITDPLPSIKATVGMLAANLSFCINERDYDFIFDAPFYYTDTRPNGFAIAPKSIPIGGSRGFFISGKNIPPIDGIMARLQLIDPETKKPFRFEIVPCNFESGFQLSCQPPHTITESTLVMVDISFADPGFWMPLQLPLNVYSIKLEQFEPRTVAVNQSVVVSVTGKGFMDTGEIQLRFVKVNGTKGLFADPYADEDSFTGYSVDVSFVEPTRLVFSTPKFATQGMYQPFLSLNGKFFMPAGKGHSFTVTESFPLNTSAPMPAQKEYDSEL